jgi:hypothetical protein
MEVPHQRLQDFAQALILNARNGRFDRLRYVSLIFDDHVFPHAAFRRLYSNKKADSLATVGPYLIGV